MFALELRRTAYAVPWGLSSELSLELSTTKTGFHIAPAALSAAAHVERLSVLLFLVLKLNPWLTKVNYSELVNRADRLLQ